MRQVQSSIKLQNGVSIPTIGLGVYQARGDECSNAVKHALDAGYRHFDSALVYVCLSLRSFVQDADTA